MQSIKHRLMNGFRLRRPRPIVVMTGGESSSSVPLSRGPGPRIPISNRLLRTDSLVLETAPRIAKHRFGWGRRRTTVVNTPTDKKKSVSGAAIKRGSDRKSTRQSHGHLKSGHSGSKSKKTSVHVSKTASEDMRRSRRLSDIRKTVQFKHSPNPNSRCSAEHDGRKLLQERLMMRVDALFDILFRPSQFLQNFHDRRKATDLKMGSWRFNSNGQHERSVTMTVALAANVGPKTVKVTETQWLRDCTNPGQLYSIDVRSINAEIPYADTFEVQMHYCLKATADDQTDVYLFAKIKFIKSVWAVVKSFIEKNTYAGLDEFAQSLYSALVNEAK